MSDSSAIDASLGIYNPASLPPDVLLEEFIARRPLLEKAIGMVRHNSPGQAQQHVLLLGPRGIGKTTFLLALAYSVQRDPQLSPQWLPVIFPEETYGIGDLADFWLYATSQLLHGLGNETALAGIDALRDANPEDIEPQARALFLQHLAGTGKRALLIIENLNDFFGAVSDQAEQHRLRAFLMESDRVMLAASSTSYFDASGKMDQPFYDFFRLIRLERLAVDETVEVLTDLAKLRNDQNVLTVLHGQPERVRSLHVLTGGNPRLIKMIYRLLNEGMEGDARRDLNRLLEDCTPYFKSRIEELSVEERRVFDHVARHWDPVAVGDIQSALRRPSNKISIYLRRLVENGFIEEAVGSTQKRKAYQVAERFYNIYYLMRFSRSSRRRLEWLVQAMSIIYSPDDFRHWTRKTLDTWQKDGDIRSREDQEAFLHALTCASDCKGLRKELVNETIATAWKQDQLDCLDRLLDRTLALETLGKDFDLIDFFAHLPGEEKEKLGYRPESAHWWYALTWPLEAASRCELAQQAYRKAIEIDPNFAYAWNSLGNLLATHFQGYEEAEKAYRKAIEIDPNLAHPWHGLGNVLTDHFQHHEEAEKAYRRAIEVDPNDAYPWYGLGTVLTDHFQRHEEAEKAYRKAIEIDLNFAPPWNGLANLLKNHFQRHEEAEKAYRKAIELDPNDASPWNGLGNLLSSHFQRYEEAEKAYHKAIEVDPNDGYPWNGLGNLLSVHFQRHEEAEKAYRKAIELDPDHAFPHAGLSEVFHIIQRNEEAKYHALRGIQLDSKGAWPRSQFLTICGQDPDSWKQLLPTLLDQLARPSSGSEVIEMALRGFEFVISSKAVPPAEAVRMITTHGSPEPLAEILLALESLENPSLLDKASPERRTVARDFLQRVKLES